MTPLPLKPERIGASQAAAILGINRRTVQSMALRGELPGAAKIGGLWTFDEAALREWVADLVEKNQFKASATRKAAIDGIDLEYERASRKLRGKPALEDAELLEAVRRERAVRAQRKEEFRLGKRSRPW